MTGPDAAEPYVGLRPYDLVDRGRFFGREREAWQLRTLVLSSRLVVLYGPAGVGKTSLLQAGVLSTLGPETAHVLPVARIPAAPTLPPEPTVTANPFTTAVLNAWSDGTAGGHETLAHCLGQVEVGLDRYQEAPLPLVAVVDQLEEAFSAGPDWALHVEELLAELAEALAQEPGLHLVLVMRQDAMGDLLHHEARMSDGRRRRYLLEPLDHDAAFAAITDPLAGTGRSFASDAAREMIRRLCTTTLTNEVGEQRTAVVPAVEPTSLQIVCLALWRTLPEQVTTITVGDVTEHGDVEAILTSFCLRAVIDVAAREHIPETAVWEWLEESFVTDLGTRATEYEGLAATGGMPRAVARAFEDHRILRSEKRSGSVWFELLHDVLIEPIRRGRRLCTRLAALSGMSVRPEAFLRMAETALTEGMLELAGEYARGAARVSAGDTTSLAEANAFLGQFALDQGRTETGARADELYATAEIHYRRAAELFDTGQQPWAVARVLASLGRLLLERGRYADAVAELHGALARLPSDVDVRLAYASALSSSGHLQAALGEYTTVLASAPEDARAQRMEALVERGRISIERGDARRGLCDLEEAVRLEPDVAARPDVVAARAQALADNQYRA